MVGPEAIRILSCIINLFQNSLDLERNSPLNMTYLAGVWKRSAEWIKPRNITAPNMEEFETLLNAMNRAKILRVSTPVKGTQLKIMLHLEGGQWAVWKPKFYERQEVVQGAATDGFDRHNGEIAAFYVGRLLGLNRIPFVAGRTLDLKKEAYDVADQPLRDTFFTNNQTGRFCFYGKCIYCTPTLSACADNKNQLEGALVLWFPAAYANLSRIRSPWARTYDPHRLANWETNQSFCGSVLKHDFFGRAPIFMDLMETSIFDFLIGNADRHRLEFFKDRAPKTVLLLDNGKSFANPDTDELTILAPLYQCCRIRPGFYKLLLRYAEINFGALLDGEKYLRMDPLYPVLTEAHLEAVNRRLRKVVAVLASCMETHGAETVLLDDGY